MEKIQNMYLHWWLGIPLKLTSLWLYISSGRLQLTLSSVREEFKGVMCRLSLTYRDSQDQFIPEVEIGTRSVQKWATSSAVGQVEC